MKGLGVLAFTVLFIFVGLPIMMFMVDWDRFSATGIGWLMFVTGVVMNFGSDKVRDACQGWSLLLIIVSIPMILSGIGKYAPSYGG
jgi:hypothetical protein